ncbi:MAG: hypothetical protein HQL71_08940 [Magnetococcales bacterium]|nr:hypothetical protein [Magnetococcales bacterium]
MRNCKPRQSIIRTVVIGICATFLTNCSMFAPDFPKIPSLPKPPKVRYETVDEATVTPVTLNAYRSVEFNISKTNDTVAIMDFQQPKEKEGSGALVADSFIMDMQRRGYQIIEREKIKNIMEEQIRISEDATKLSDLDVAKRVGKLLQADYFLIGAVTEFESSSQVVPLSKILQSSDIDRYTSQQEAYEDQRPKKEKACKEYLEHFKNAKCIMPPSTTLDEWNEKIAGKSKNAFAPIARVGLTSKLIDVKTSKIVWVGQANVSDNNLQKGMTRITSKMIQHFLTSQ